MDALVITDIQNDFLPGGRLPVPEGDLIIPVVHRVIPHFGLIVALQDWHPPGHMSFASNHPGKKPLDRIVLDGLEQVLWPDHCVQGTPGADFSTALDLNPVEAIFRKGTNPAIDSYSGFFDNARKKATGLEGYLKARGVDRIWLSGLAADYCVLYTALDALSLGFKAVVIRDATRAITAPGGEAAEKSIVSKGGRYVSSLEITGKR
ncbi:MAG: bifunctional nicotinamidase/pyrazinamidase [Candidatus Aminicenantales bacterium]